VPVSEFLGSNSRYGDNLPDIYFWDAMISLVSTGSDNSPHSNYLCQGLSCAKGTVNSAVLQNYRNSEAYSPSTIITRDDVDKAKALQKQQEPSWSDY